jgi:hypothetical protein
VRAAAADKIAGAAHAMFHETAPPAGAGGAKLSDVGMWENLLPTRPHSQTRMAELGRPDTQGASPTGRGCHNAIRGARRAEKRALIGMILPKPGA